MHRLPIESDSYFNSYGHVPERFRRFLIPSARYHFSSDGANDMLDMNISLDGFSIWIHYLWLKGDILLQPFNTKDTFALHFWLARSIPAKLRDLGLVDVADCILFFLKAMEHAAWAASGISLSMHINVDPYNLVPLSTEFPQLAFLKNLPAYTNSTPINPMPFSISAVNFRILKRILHCRYIGIFSECYLRRNCVSLYTNYLKELSTEVAQIVMLEEDRRKLYRILQFVGSHPEMVVSHEYLAERFHINIITMRVGFEQEFHVSLFDFVQQERMNKAFSLLMNYSIDDIARKLGYPATFLFSADFEMFYGRDPRQLQMAQ
ncbi:AraC-type DNA-binding protein [Chitinophaga sp. CF118]|uniref:helix-turn-helix transcriptional regulator n=1 Tax=Chitinophaga sp. CF118 TaxID=1884367 RepID=UPI0008E95B45|nr:AraC family transcriptional regulator [Chitinophaga sp. CF118]SFE45013.1 AraC-type DNA-binding protein [Chitinophaga sp. CF118]